MLKAKEAVELALTSTKNVNEMLDKIEEQIILSATDGGRSINLSELFPDKFPAYSVGEYERHPELTKFQERVQSKVKEDGYGFIVYARRTDANRTLGSMADPEDPPRIVISCGFEVRW